MKLGSQVHQSYFTIRSYYKAFQKRQPYEWPLQKESFLNRRYFYQACHTLGGATYMAVGDPSNGGNHQPDRDAAANIPGLQGEMPAFVDL